MIESKTSAALAGKNVFITGTSGFVGKVVLEKLLRDVPDVGQIYLLLRGNRKFPDASLRFSNDIAQSSVFDRLREEFSDDVAGSFEKLCDAKITCVEGELTAPRFGLTETEFQQLAGNIDLIVNSAASVNFREALDAALQINTLCLNNIVSLAEAAGDIPVVQVSTCYVNGFNKGLMEEDNVHPTGDGITRSPFGYFEVEDLIERMQARISTVEARFGDPEIREKALIELGIKQAQKLGWNDTYTLTKWMGEQLLMKALYGKKLTILRPSIVESTLQGPKPGWIEGVKVADAIILAYAREKVSFFPGNKHAVLDIIPADLVANSILLSAAEALKAPPQLRIYQCASSDVNPLRISDLIGFVQSEAESNHAKLKRLFPKKPERPFVMVPRLVFNTAGTLVYRTLQTTMRALELVGKGRNTRTLHNLQTTLKLATIFSFYTAPKYRFSNRKLLDLAERMGETDKKLFPVDASNFDWQHYMRQIHIPGLNCYALKPRRTIVTRDVVAPEETARQEAGQAANA